MNKPQIPDENDALEKLREILNTVKLEPNTFDTNPKSSLKYFLLKEQSLKDEMAQFESTDSTIEPESDLKSKSLLNSSPENVFDNISGENDLDFKQEETSSPGENAFTMEDK